MNVTLHDLIQDIVNDNPTTYDIAVNDDYGKKRNSYRNDNINDSMDDNSKSVFTKSIVNRFSKMDLEKGTHYIN